MFQKQRESVWNWFCFLIMLVQLCAPFLFPADDDDPDPANDLEGGTAVKQAAFSNTRHMIG